MGTLYEEVGRVFQLKLIDSFQLIDLLGSIAFVKDNIDSFWLRSTETNARILEFVQVSRIFTELAFNILPISSSLIIITSVLINRNTATILSNNRMWIYSKDSYKLFILYVGNKNI